MTQPAEHEELYDSTIVNMDSTEITALLGLLFEYHQDKYMSHIDMEGYIEGVPLAELFDKYIDTEEIPDIIPVEDLVAVSDPGTLATSLAISYPQEASELLDELLYWRETGNRI